MINYLDRSAIAVAAPFLTKQLSPLEGSALVESAEQPTRALETDQYIVVYAGAAPRGDCLQVALIGPLGHWSAA